MHVIFILRDGTEKTVSFIEGKTILEVAKENDILLNSACDGLGICGCCHVIIENLQNKLPKISDLEENALDKARVVTLKSRLACRVTLDKSLDGIIVKLI